MEVSKEETEWRTAVDHTDKEPISASSIPTHAISWIRTQDISTFAAHLHQHLRQGRQRVSGRQMGLRPFCFCIFRTYKILASCDELAASIQMNRDLANRALKMAIAFHSLTKGRIHNTVRDNQKISLTIPRKSYVSLASKHQ